MNYSGLVRNYCGGTIHTWTGPDGLRCLYGITRLCTIGILGYRETIADKTKLVSAGPDTDQTGLTEKLVVDS